MRASRRKNTKGKCEGKVVIRSAACAAFALGLLLAPAPARCADGPAPLTVEDCLGTSKRPHTPPWVDGTSGPDTCWGALHDSDSSYLDISPPPQVPAKSRSSMHMFCSHRSSHYDNCPRSEYCARTPDRDGPHWVVVYFDFEQRRPPATEPKRKRRRMPRPRKHQEIPLRVGLWSIGIGGSLAAPPLPHHRAYGSVHGGSTDLSGQPPGVRVRHAPGGLRSLGLRRSGLHPSPPAPRPVPTGCSAAWSA